MKVENNIIKETTLDELRDYWVEMEWDQSYSFEEYCRIMKSLGIKITKDVQTATSNM